jgi:hypothetical protein
MGTPLGAFGAEANVAVVGRETRGRPVTYVISEQQLYGRRMTAVKAPLSGSRSPPPGKGIAERFKPLITSTTRVERSTADGH